MKLKAAVKDHGGQRGAGGEAEETFGEAEDAAGGQAAVDADPDHPGSAFLGALRPR